MSSKDQNNVLFKRSDQSNLLQFDCIDLRNIFYASIEVEYQRKSINDKKHIVRDSFPRIEN